MENTDELFDNKKPSKNEYEPEDLVYLSKRINFEKEYVEFDEDFGITNIVFNNYDLFNYLPNTNFILAFEDSILIALYFNLKKDFNETELLKVINEYNIQAEGFNVSLVKDEIYTVEIKTNINDIKNSYDAVKRINSMLDEFKRSEYIDVFNKLVPFFDNIKLLNTNIGRK